MDQCFYKKYILDNQFYISVKFTETDEVDYSVVTIFTDEKYTFYGEEVYVDAKYL